MTQEKQNEIIECVKYLCDNKKYDVDFDEIEIHFTYYMRPICRNYVVVDDCVDIINKQYRYIFTVASHCDPRTISKFLLDGYMKEKSRFIYKHNEAKKDE